MILRHAHIPLIFSVIDYYKVKKRSLYIWVNQRHSSVKLCNGIINVFFSCHPLRFSLNILYLQTIQYRLSASHSPSCSKLQRFGRLFLIIALLGVTVICECSFLNSYDSVSLRSTSRSLLSNSLMVSGTCKLINSSITRSSSRRHTAYTLLCK